MKVDPIAENVRCLLLTWFELTMKREKSHVAKKTLLMSLKSRRKRSRLL